MLIELARSLSPGSDTAPQGWEDWLNLFFPSYVAFPFADYHREFWAWVEALSSQEKPRPYVAIWPRGGGKTTSVELAISYVACTLRRRYVLYVAGTQGQADEKVGNIGELLTNRLVSEHYPTVGTPKVSRFGHVRGWRRSGLRAANGFSVDAFGLDTSMRGTKIDDIRPDLIVFDDVDGRHDTAEVTAKKIEKLTQSLLPAGSANAAVVGVQNLIIPNGVFSQLADNTAPFLYDREVSGPHPAVEGLAYERRANDDGSSFYKITAGKATWEGQSLQTCEAQLNEWGPESFEREAQHNVDRLIGSLYENIEFRYCKPDEVPDLVRTVCWVDPAVSETAGGSSQAIQIDGIDENGFVYRLYSWEQQALSDAVMRQAITMAMEFGCHQLGVETDQGGDTWRVVFEKIMADLGNQGLISGRPPAYKFAKAGSIGSKMERQQQMRVDYEKGVIIHVLGTHDLLDKALRRFPVQKPFDLADAAFWSWFDLAKPAYRAQQTSYLGRKSQELDEDHGTLQQGQRSRPSKTRLSTHSGRQRRGRR